MTALLLILSLAQHTAAGPAPDAALKALLAGNARYVASHVRRPHQGAARRTEVAKGQHPIAIVLSCSDSRVPPEIVFDQGLGDLFVVRVAGNVVNDANLGSIEYAVEHLGARLILVLGHERCGAVDAALKGGEAAGHVGALIEAIKPAVDVSKGQPGDKLDNAVRANAKRQAHELGASSPMGGWVSSGKVKIVPTRYDLDTGKVEVLK